MSNNNHINTLAEEIQEDVEWIENSLDLDLNGVTLRIRTNHLPLLEQLERYFAHVTPGSSDPDIEIFALEREALDTGLPFVDWAREAGKSGRKDSYADLSGGRVVRKIRTGMLFLQSESIRMAVGPCLQYDNQVINFICSQYMNWLQQNQWLVCHASGLEIQGRGVGIAGFSGGGKSTLMLNLLENEQINYLTNDRLFINSEGGTASARGIPKLPRVNPGTIVHNRRLHGLLSAQRREALLQLPPTELWSLEEKYDVLIAPTYGKNRVTTEARLDTFVLLNWQRESSEESRITEINIRQRRELLAALMKSPGPFYQKTDGSFQNDSDPFDEERYLNALDGVTIYEVSGKVDFDAVQSQLTQRLGL